MNFKILVLFCIFLNIFFASPGSAASQNANLKIKKSQFDDLVHQQGLFFEDKKGNLTIDDFLAAPNSLIFSPKHKNNFGYSPSAYWFKLNIDTDSIGNAFVLACENTTINYLDFYLVDANGEVVKSNKTGNSRPFSTREYDNRYFIFNLPLKSNSTYQIFVRIASEDAVDFNMVLADYNSYFDHHYRLQMIEGIYFGCILIMGLYNLFLYLVIFDVSYLYYVLYIFSALLFQFELGGWFNQYLMKDLPTISNKMGGVFLSLEILFILQFMQAFSGNVHHPKFVKNIFYSIKCIAVAEIVACIFIPLKYNLPFFIVLCMCGVIPCIMYAIFSAYTQGVSSAKFMIVGWSCIAFGGIMYALASLGFTPFNFFATYSTQIGTILELLFLSFALADRINVLRVEKQQAQRETIVQLEENAVLLQRLNDEQIKAFGAVIQGEENERKRLAFELHDGIGQLLSVVKLNLSSLEHWVDKRNKEAAEVVRSIVALVDDSCREVRNISHNLMPNTVVQFGLMAALKDFCRKINNAKKIRLHFQNLDFEPDLLPQVQTTLYRIIQEIVHNAIRHSHATDVYIQLFLEDEKMVLLIEDNGIGFDMALIHKGSNGMGIRNIISRIEYLKGEVHIDASPGKGTMYNINLNLQHHQVLD
ncbi:MAG: 7TM diverse intracellular signaling domain-containing protein [Cytophagales bacterium]